MKNNNEALSPCGCSKENPCKNGVEKEVKSGWNKKYFLLLIGGTVLWLLAYFYILPFSSWLTFEVFNVEKETKLGSSIEFFLYDTAKIFLLLVAMIYGVAWLRASLNIEKIRDFLTGKNRGIGYFLGSSFGAVTPFCSCSSVPLFLGFTTARIPIGVSMSFLITSPLINEVAVVMLWGLLGWKFTVIYIFAGIMAGIMGGWFMDRIKAGRWLQPFILETINKNVQNRRLNSVGEIEKLTIQQRHIFAYDETKMIFKRVWKWVLIGVGIGAAVHGLIPDNWFAENFSAEEWWTVPAAVFVAIPLYSNVTGVIPIMESLLMKGLPLGTTMAFCMSAVVASIPEFMMLRQIMTIKLQGAFMLYLWLMLNVVGFIFNFIGPYII